MTVEQFAKVMKEILEEKEWFLDRISSPGNPRKLTPEEIEQLEKAVAYTSALFQSAQSTYLEILSAQQSLLSAQLTEVSDNVQRMQAVVSLYSAIGGGRE